MNKEDTNIDNELKEKFGHHNFGSPPDDFLADINRRLDEDEESDRFVWWLLDGTLILCFLSLLLYSQINQNTIHVAQQITKQNSSETPDDIGKSIYENDNSLIVNDSVSDNTQQELSKKLIPENEMGTEEYKNNSKGKPIQKRIHKNRGKKQLNIKQEDKLETKEQSKDHEKSVIDAFLKDKSKKTKNKSIGVENKPHESSNREKEKRQKDERKQDEMFEQLPHLKFDVYATEYDLVNQRIKDNNFTYKNDFASEQEASLKNEPFLSTKTIDNNSLVVYKSNFYEIQGFGGLSFGWPRTFKSFSDDYSNLLKADLDNDEVSPNFGINFNFVRKRIVLGTGVEYFHFDEEIEHVEVQINTTDTVILTGYEWVYTYDSLGVPIDSNYVSVYDTTKNVNKTDKSFEIEQRYSWIAIPIQIGYRFFIGQNWSITPSVGGNIALGFRRKTYQYPSHDYNQLEEYQSVKWMLSLQGTVEVRRKIKNWHLFFKTGYYFGLTPYIKSNLLQRKYSHVNGVIGIGYSF